MTEQLDDQREFEKNLEKLMPHWLSHNDQHIRDNEKWLGIIEGMGLERVARELKEAIAILKEANNHVALANKELKDAEVDRPADKPAEKAACKNNRG
ncbi:MAG: hypothetical protein SWK76_02110 [Actinomycetota bacterium]|nr:hypothetical protein [Actinomycetota bacterium]